VCGACAQDFVVSEQKSDKPASPQMPHVTRRTMIVSATIAAAFVGFLLGTGPRSSSAASKSSDPIEDSQAPRARSHAELAANPWRIEQAGWTPAPIPASEPVTPANREAYLAATAKRASQRAFEGAPPTIPHPTGQLGDAGCRICHENGAQIGERIAPAMSHRVVTMCTQCHVPDSSALPGPPLEAASAGSSFEGARGSATPYRYAPGSPPQIPHSTQMRERCISCHGPSGSRGLQTSHPERAACTQCHTAAAAADQRDWSRK
jgi:cytochrome c-type protein NapB